MRALTASRIICNEGRDSEFSITNITSDADGTYNARTAAGEKVKIVARRRQNGKIAIALPSTEPSVVALAAFKSGRRLIVRSMTFFTETTVPPV